MPPDVVEDSVVVAPMNVVNVPVIEAGVAGVVSMVKGVDIVVLPQLLDTVYLIVSIPAATPVTTPVEASTVANNVLVLLHTPPIVESDNVEVAPMQADIVPVIAGGAAGSELIVTVVVV